MNGRGRGESREDFDPGVRIALLEDDMDNVDRSVVRMEEWLRKLTMAMVTAALSLATATVLLALNLAL